MKHTTIQAGAVASFNGNLFIAGICLIFTANLTIESFLLSKKEEENYELKF